MDCSDHLRILLSFKIIEIYKRQDCHARYVCNHQFSHVPSKAGRTLVEYDQKCKSTMERERERDRETVRRG